MERHLGRKKPPVRELNAHLVCVLCGGYFIDPFTLVECLHSFCRACIIRHLESSKFCPICDLQINKTKLSQCMKPDSTLQSLVFKVIPTVYQSELRRRRDFYSQREAKDMAPSTPNYGLGNDYYSPEDSISLSLQYYNGKEEENEDVNQQEQEGSTEKVVPYRRYLQCPAAVSMKHLKKFIRLKYGLSCEHRVDVIYLNECLPDDFTLMDVAYTFSWKRTSPMRFHYRIFQKPTYTRVVLPVSHTVTKEDSKSVESESVNNSCSTSPTDNSVPSSDHTISTINEEPPAKKLRMACESDDQVGCSTASPEVSLQSESSGSDEQIDTTQSGESMCADNVHCEVAPPAPSLQGQDTCINSSEEELKSVADTGEVEVNENTSKVESTLVDTSQSDATLVEDNESAIQETKRCSDQMDKKTDVGKEADTTKNLKRCASSEEDGSCRSSEHEKKHKDDKEHSGRKKGKHKYKYLKGLDDKKRPIIVAPTILHNPDDVMKLKVKLNPVPVIPNSHHHKHHHHSKHHHSKHHKSNCNSNLNNNVTTSQTIKERLLQMRAVRHKTNKQIRTEKSPEEIFQKQKASLLVPPSSLTVSKVSSSEKRMNDLNKLSGGNNGIENKRPSLEIMLVSSKKSGNSSSMQVKTDETKKSTTDTNTKVSRPLPASIPLVRTSKHSSTPIKTPQGLTITPKITHKHDETSSKNNFCQSKLNVSPVRGKKLPDNALKSKVQDLKLQEKPLSPKLSEGSQKLPEKSSKGCKHSVGSPSMRHDNCGALDLSGKSSRKSDTSSPSPTLEVPPVSNTNLKNNTSILAIAQNLVHKQLSNNQGSNGVKSTRSSPVPISTGTSNATPATGMSNLKTLSDAAVRIRNLMAAAETKVPSPSNSPVVTNSNNNHNKNGNPNYSPNRNSLQFNSNHSNNINTNNNNLKSSPVKVQNTPSYTAGSTLRIPVPQTTLKYPSGRGLSGRPTIPRLNEIVSRGRGGRGSVPLACAKQGPNLGVRHIPNPSALFRQQSINKNINGKSVSGSLSSTPSEKGMFNGNKGACSPVRGQSEASNGSLAVSAAPIRKIENMTRNIEKVAAGLTVRAVEANGAPKLT